MIELPFPIVDYLCKQTIKTYSPAYLLVDKDGHLSSWGGQLTFYGVTNLQKSKEVGEQVFFLQGIFPLDGSDLFLPCIQIENHLAVDVHIFPTDEGDWVLLLDATSTENQRQLLQQKGNELSLLRQKQAKLLHHYFKKQISKKQIKKISSLQVKGERREITILSANIGELANYSEINSPEIVCRTLNSYLSVMLPPIVNEAGLVDKILADGVMGCFGVLPSTGSPPMQAIKAALQMIEAVKDVARQDKNQPILNISIGIASGPVVLGIVGSNDWSTFTATGYYVHLAEQLKNQSQSWQVLIDENTFNKLEDIQNHFSVNDGFISGKIEPIKTYSYLLK
jgi:class 3 adenylate cyclase